MIGGAVLLAITLNVPLEQPTLFLVMIAATAVLMPWPAANVLSTVSDVALPEVRSTGVALLNFMEQAGSALAPLLAGIIADATSLGNAILLISTVTWGLCGLFFLLTMWLLPRDLQVLRSQLSERAARLRAEAGD